MAKVIKQMTIRMQDGASAVLSTAEVGASEYETLLASPDFGTEYAVKRTTSEAQALADFKHLRKRYHVPELSGKYAELSQALRTAAEAGKVAARLSDDGGTCNFDAATLHLKGWNGRKVEQAAQEAGVGCFVWNLWGSKSYVFPLRIGAQGNARTAAAEAMSASLKASGYDSGVYYQMD